MSEVTPRVSVARFFGVALALFLLSGRWSLARLGFTEAWALLEPRMWIVTAMTVVAYAPAVSRALQSRPGARSSLGSCLAFLGFFVLSAVWAPESELSGTKAYEMVLVALALISVARIARWVGVDTLMREFWSAMTIALVVIAVLGMLATASSGGTRLSVLGGGPNVFGRNMVVLLIVCLTAALGTRNRAFWIGGAVIAGVLALLSGSRGAMLGMAAGSVTVVYAKRLPLGRFVRIALGLAIFAGLVVMFTEVGRSALATFEERFIRLTLEDHHDAGRMPIYAHAWALGVAAPLFGQGLAGFAATGFHVYPHNIVLEAFCEGGLVGAALLVGVLVPAVARIVIRDSAVAARDLGVLVVLLASAMFTGDFFDSRGVLVMVLLISMQRARGSESAELAQVGR